MMEKIRRWRKGKTTILITHDVSQIQSEGYVYVLDTGNLVQEGFQKDLATHNSGVFAYLVAHISGSAGTLTELFKVPESQPPLNSARQTIYTTSRLSRVVHHQDNNDLLRIGGPFNTALGEGTRQFTTMRKREVWTTPLGHKSQLHSKITHVKHNDARRQRHTEPPPGIYGIDYRQGSRYPTGRRSSLDIVDEVGQTTRALRPSALVKELDWASQKPVVEADRPRNVAPTGDSITATTNMVCVPAYKIIGTAWPVLSKSDRIRAAVGLAACLVMAACNPAFSFVFAHLLAAFWALASEMAFKGQTWAIFLAVIAIVDGFAVFLTYYLIQCVGQAWITSLRIEAFKRILSQPKHFFEKERNSPSHIVETLDRCAEETRNLLGQFVPTMIVFMMMMSSALVWSLIISWRLTLVALAATPAVYLSIVVNTSVSARRDAEFNRATEKTALVADETFTNIL